jgi:hypothetical protein
MRTFGAVSMLVLAGALQAWAAGPVDQSFPVKKVHLDSLVAQVMFDNAPAGAPIHVVANGKPEILKRLEVRTIGDEVFVHLADSPGGDAWFPWNLFNQWHEKTAAADLQIHISAPLGTPVEIEDMIGRVQAGDLDAPLQLEGTSLEAHFGRVTTARVSVAGSGKIQVGAVQQTLDVEVAGSGRLDVASAASARVEIAGGGNINIGPIAGGLRSEVAGSGDVRAASINGPLDVEIAGSGSVYVDGGRGAPFKAEIAGSGDVVFNGQAVDPNIQIYGSGSVKVRSYTGQLHQEMAGSGSFEVMEHGQGSPPAAQPSSMAPPAPPPPPAPPAKPH